MRPIFCSLIRPHIGVSLILLRATCRSQKSTRVKSMTKRLNGNLILHIASCYIQSLVNYCRESNVSYKGPRPSTGRRTCPATRTREVNMICARSVKIIRNRRLNTSSGLKNIKLNILPSLPHATHSIVPAPHHYKHTSLTPVCSYML